MHLAIVRHGQRNIAYMAAEIKAVIWSRCSPRPLRVVCSAFTFRRRPIRNDAIID